MKISKEYLKRVIAEEIDRTLSEGKKMKIAVKGKKKVDEIANVSSYNHDFLDREEETPDQRWKDYLYQKEKEEYQKRKEEEERWNPPEKSGDQSGYWNYSESIDPKKKVKN